MNQRQKELLKELVYEQDFVTVQQLANRMNISLRTAYNDVKCIEEFLKKQNIILDKKTNVGIKIHASESIKKSLLNYTDETKEAVDVLSTKMRRMKITSRLLSHKEGTSLNRLSEEFMVSKTSIVKDFEVIEKKLNKYNLALVRDRKGTRVIGNENDIRHGLSQLASSFLQFEFEEEEQERQATRLDLSTFNRLKNIFDVDYIDKVEEIVLEAEKKLGYTINEISYVNLITHLLILIKRIKSLSFYNEEESERIFTIEPVERTMAVAHFIASSISESCGIHIPNGEIKYIHQYLVCSGIQNDFLHLDVDNYSLNIKEEYLDLIDQMISFVSDSVHFDLRQDKELKLSIITHFIPMVRRIQYHVKIENPLIHEIKSKYSAMFSIVTLAIEILHNDLLNNLNDDEIGFLTIHFQAAVERSMEQKQVIVVCPEGIGFSRLIAHRIERFVSSVRIVDIVSLRKLNTMDLSKIDFVISTVPIQKCEKPVVLVSTFLSEFDIRDINNYLIESSQNLKHHKLEHLLKIIDETVVFAQVDFRNKEDVLKYICKQMYDNGYVTKEYQQTVFEREAIMSTDLGNRIAIPHGSEKEIIESKVAVVTLKSPILWNQHHVDVIFLIAMNMKNPQKTKNILKDLYSIMDSKKILEELVNADNKEEIIQCIQR